jgi:hypothetical protein
LGIRDYRRRLEVLEQRHEPRYQVNTGDAVRLRQMVEAAQAARNRAQEPPQESPQPPPEPVRSASVEPDDLVLDHLLTGSQSRTARAALDYSRQKDRDHLAEYRDQERRAREPENT